MLKIINDAVVVEFSNQYRDMEDVQRLRIGLYKALKAVAVSKEINEDTMEGVFHIANLLEELELSNQETVHLSQLHGKELSKNKEELKIRKV